MEKKTIVLTNRDNKIIAMTDYVINTATSSKVQIRLIPRNGQNLHIVNFPEEYHLLKTNREKQFWLKDYIVINNELKKI